MVTLVGDVGGTNCRLAIASGGQLQTESIKRYPNARFSSIYDAIDAYLKSQNSPQVAACCIALAGPVTAQKAKLTNIDWEVSVQNLKQHLSCDHAQILNDLTALGHSLKATSPDNLIAVCDGLSEVPANGQSLVIGIGTGFNVCPVISMENNRSTCLKAEYGHTNMSQNVLELLGPHQPAGAQQFNIVEELFSGRGLSLFHSLLTHQPAISGLEIIAAYEAGTDAHAETALTIFSRALGIMTSELILKYLPLDGIYFAGSVARALFVSGFRSEFKQALTASSHFKPEYSSLPITVINDDAAALMGCYLNIRQERETANGILKP